ncbi:MAG: hypothetical protein OXG05_08345 [Gammaproteobacteria bacterium]|nr:hypothetical protein [Gammaproteobacteria bacterium]
MSKDQGKQHEQPVEAILAKAIKTTAQEQKDLRIPTTPEQLAQAVLRPRKRSK